MNKTIDVLVEVENERRHQDHLLSLGRFKFNCATPGVDPGAKLAVLGEEFGEVCKAVTEGGNLREELIQLAAVAVGWVESLEQ